MHQRAYDIGHRKKSENIRTSEILFQQGHLRIQGSVHALDKITVSKCQAGYEELEMHRDLVIKITM